MAIIRPSADLRNKYNEIFKICHETNVLYLFIFTTNFNLRIYIININLEKARYIWYNSFIDNIKIKNIII